MRKEIMPVDHRNYRITFPADIIRTANRFDSRIYIIQNDQRLNAKSLLSMMLLLLTFRSAIVIETEGSDETEAMEAIISFLKNDRNVSINKRYADEEPMTSDTIRALP